MDISDNELVIMYTRRNGYDKERNSEERTKILTNYFKVKVDKAQQNIKRRLCREKDEVRVRECHDLVQNESRTMHN